MKQKPIKSTHAGCLCCPGNTSCLDLDTELSFDLGGYIVHRNMNIYYMDNGEGVPKKLKDIEGVAKDSPDDDWVVELSMPLRGAVWQRHDGKWMLVSENEGFA